MPLNAMDAHYQSFQQLVLPVLVAGGIGMLAMKPMGDGIILESKTVTPVECLHYAMNLPTSVVITGCDSIEYSASNPMRTHRPLNSFSAGFIPRINPSRRKNSRIMTVRELADYLRVHPTTIYRQLKSRQLPAFKVGSDWRFNVEAIDRWCPGARQLRGAAGPQGAPFKVSELKVPEIPQEAEAKN
jgi:excisionase family DNA binding protein